MCLNCGYGKQFHNVCIDYAKREKMLWKNKGVLTDAEYRSCEYYQCRMEKVGEPYQE